MHCCVKTNCWVNNELTVSPYVEAYQKLILYIQLSKVNRVQHVAGISWCAQRSSLFVMYVTSQFSMIKCIATVYDCIILYKLWKSTPKPSEKCDDGCVINEVFEFFLMLFLSFWTNILAPPVFVKSQINIPESSWTVNLQSISK